MRKTKPNSISRRDFIRDAAVTGAVAATGLAGETAIAAHSQPDSQISEDRRCPFFDQPLFCTGPGPDGSYPCD